ncbi:MAG: hypothetical protein ACI819_002765, partial [Neolewinella sp.]
MCAALLKNQELENQELVSVAISPLASNFLIPNT